MEQTIIVKAGQETAVRLELAGFQKRATGQEEVRQILKQAQGIRPAGMLNAVFYQNLLRIDSNLPLMYTWLVYLLYRREESPKTPEILVRQLEKANPLGISEGWIYREKMQQLLVELCLGMEARREWKGSYDQIVRRIHIQKEDKVYVFQGTERQRLGQFLLEQCEVYESGKTEGLESVYEEDGRYFLNLSLAIAI